MASFRRRTGNAGMNWVISSERIRSILPKPNSISKRRRKGEKE
jgi:hypothetical protein